MADDGSVTPQIKSGGNNKGHAAVLFCEQKGMRLNEPFCFLSFKWMATGIDAPVALAFAAGAWGPAVDAGVKVEMRVKKGFFGPAAIITLAMKFQLFYGSSGALFLFCAGL